MNLEYAFVSGVGILSRARITPNRTFVCRSSATPPPAPPEKGQAASTSELKSAPVPASTIIADADSPPPPSFAEILTERTIDTVDDISLHYGRLFRDKGTSGVKTRKPRIVVLGSGWAAHSFIKVVDVDKFEVTVVSPRNFYFFTPLLCATAVGSIEFRSIVDPIRRANPLVSFYEASCTDVDVRNNEVICEPVSNGEGAKVPFRVSYDYLLYAVGERSASYGVPGVREHAYFLKELTDSVRLRRAILKAFESAALPGVEEEEKKRLVHFVVVGGGPTGCEFAGELSDFVSSDVFRKYRSLREYTRVTLVQSGDAILTTFEVSLQGRALQQFENSNIDVRLNSRVKEVTKDAVVLGDGSVLPCEVVVWAAGNGPRDITLQLASTVNKSAGYEVPPQPEKARKLFVDDWMLVKGTSNIFALGDCARLPVPLPATAQVAGQQGAYMARAFRRWDYNQNTKKKSKSTITNGAPESKANGVSDFDVEWRKVIKPFRFLSLGAMSYIGSATAVVQMEAGENSPKLAISGFISYLIWLSTYAVKQVATRNRVLVLFDVFKTKVFGRDSSGF